VQVPAQRQAKRKHEAIPEVAQELADAPTNLLDVGRAKPSEALTLLGNYVGAEGRDTWQKRARIAAVLGSCPKSKAFFLAGGAGPRRLSNVSVQNPCVLGGLRHWIEYVRIAKGLAAPPFPAEVDDILGWSMTFRCVGTFGNYLGHVRSASCALGFAPPPVGDPAIKRAYNAIAKRMLFSPRLV